MYSRRFEHRIFDELNTEDKARYIAREIMDYFKPPPLEQHRERALVVIIITILANIFLLVAILAKKNIKKSSNVLELARGLSEILLLVSISVQSTRNTLNTTDIPMAVSGFVLFWLFSVWSVCFGLMKAFTGFLHFRGKPSFSSNWLKISIVFIILTFLALIVLCVVYVVEVMAFVVLVCIFYYLPFLGMWILDGLRILHLRNCENKNESIEMDTMPRDNPNGRKLRLSNPGVQLNRPMLNFIVILCSLCHTVALAVVSVIIARIASQWMHYRPPSLPLRKGPHWK